MSGRTAVFTLCPDRSRDKAAPGIWDALARTLELRDTGTQVEGFPVMEHLDAAGDRFVFIRTQVVVTTDNRRYMGALEPYFGVASLLGIVNWHEGGGAPEAIFTAHTIADSPSGQFGPVAPRLLRGMLFALEEARATAGLDRFTTWTEASHWSGTRYGQPPELLHAIPVPVLDIEIGSEPASWTDPRASEVVARALPGVFRNADAAGELVPLLCLGGLHFEPSFREAALGSGRPYGLGTGHILPNQWLVGGEYEEGDGLAMLRAAAQSIQGGIAAIVFHDNLKGPLKALGRALGEELGVPALKHQRLRNPEDFLREVRASRRFKSLN
jgi:D-tyrosyl-tRNA(Tyr) deacylase